MVLMANDRLRALEETEKEIAMILQCAGLCSIDIPSQSSDVYFSYNVGVYKCLYFVFSLLNSVSYS